MVIKLYIPGFLFLYTSIGYTSDSQPFFLGGPLLIIIFERVTKYNENDENFNYIWLDVCHRYICEQIFPRMKQTKAVYRSRLTDEPIQF